MRKSLVMRRFLSLVLALSLIMAMSLSAFASEGNMNASVKEDRTGIVQVNLVYTDENNDRYVIATGTGFMINDLNVVTCNHVTQLSESDMKSVADYFDIDTKKLRDRLSIRISVMRDVSIKAKITTNSAQMDFAVLELESKLSGVKSLPLRSSDDLNQTEDCFALGFPGEITDFQDAVTYTSEDVTITYGKVNKVTTIGGVEYVVHSAKQTAGNSGGALVDWNGNVVGIIQGRKFVDGMTESYSYAIATDVLIETLDRLGVSYLKPNDPTPTGPVEPTPTEALPVTVNKDQLKSAIDNANTYNEKDYTKESFATLSDAKKAAETVYNSADSTQTAVDDATRTLNGAIADLKDVTGLPIPIWLIAVIALAVIAIIVALILMTRNSKKPAPRRAAAAPSMPPQPAPIPPVQPMSSVPPVNYSGGAGTSVLGGGSNETTVLSGGGNETTVLSADFGTLTRISTGEKVTINKERFVIGRERGRVDYCISDNTAVGRTHAIIVNRGGSAYVIDQNSRNCTYVNDVRAGANQEIKINSGDKITFADEAFTYNAR